MSPLRLEERQTQAAYVSDVESTDEVIFCGRQAGRPKLLEEVKKAKIKEQAPGSSLKMLNTRPKTKNRRSKPAQSHDKSRTSPGRYRSLEDAAIDDYLSNLPSSEDNALISQNMFSNLQDLGGSDGFSSGSEDSEDLERRFLGSEYDNSLAIKVASTSEADEAHSTRVIAHRIRRKKVQYLILRPNLAASDAVWLSKEEVMKSNELEEAVKKFQAARLSEDIEYSPDISEGTTPDPEEMESDLRLALEDVEEENARDAARTINMSDEHFAKLVAKQEELGIDSSDLILFDDLGAELSWKKMTKSTQSGKRMFAESRKSHKARTSHGKHISHTEMPTDYIYNDIGVPTNPNRSSRRSRGPNVALGLSDSDLVENLRKAWEKDRSTKKNKKRQREELRRQGLLGKHGDGDADLKAKYAAGMRLEDIKAEIKAFMESPRQSISFPNMDPQARKTVHGICHKLGLKSKSMGSGVARFPILYKTSRMRSFSESAFSHVRRKGFGAPGRPNRLSGPVERAQLSRNVSYGQYRDGEVVGASAPELGQENKGRAMLEKMGWSKGTNLGATNNPGIAEPVAQVIKRSRAGLG